MSYLILTITFLSGIVTSSFISTYHSPCARLVAIEEARDAKVKEQEEKTRAFFTPRTQPPTPPVFKERGL